MAARAGLGKGGGGWGRKTNKASMGGVLMFLKC